MEPISTSIAEFGWDMFKEINSCKSDSNFLCSPMSMTSLLSLLSLGSRGETDSQIKKVLHVSDQGHAPDSPETLQAGSAACGGEHTALESGQVSVETDIHNQLKALFSKLKSAGDTKLTIAHGLFTQLKFPISKNYLTSSQALYQAKVKSVDFAMDKTREEINTWVEKETNGKIKNLFAPNSLSKDTCLILVNAIYFKGKWMKMFKKDDTKDALFHVKEDVNITVPMMSQTDTFNHAIVEEVDAQIIELPYGNGNFSMFILLPNNISGLEKVTKQMTLKLLAKCTDPKNLQSKKIELQFPRFKIEASYDLTSHLQNMGMKDAFSQQKADLSGISTAGLFVSTVIHKAFIEINEEGTEAAAATGAVIVPKSLKPPIHVNVNHPFLCVLKHNATNTILFCLKLNSPSP